MGLLDKLRGEFIDIIEWLDDSNDTMAYRFERQGNEIKNGAKLIVRPGQEAVFVSEGQVADEFPPGTYTLETKNLPLLSTLQGWKYGFNSPFKAEVYFFSTKQFTNLKWGTSNPITLRDPEIGPVRLRAYGTYNIRIAHGATLLRQLVSTDGRFETDEVSDALRSFIVSNFVSWLGKSGIAVYDFAARYVEIGEEMRRSLQPNFAEFGLEIMQVNIENIGLPPEVEKALDKRTQMGILGDMNKYTQFQAANAIEASAQNPGGGNPALDLAMGVALGNQVAQNLGGAQQAAAPAPAGPPPLPQTAQWYVAVNGQQEGPVDAGALQQRIAAGQVTRQTLVWKAGMPAWTAAGEVADLNALFGAVPPPLPPPPAA
jgi:membrane protease subunit (stomatin/prohibitin family)